MLHGLIAYANDDLIPLVNRFRSLQDVAGHVTDDPALAKDLLEKMRRPVRTIFAELGTPQCADAFEKDLDDWLSIGLNNTPAFDRTLSAHTIPEDGEAFFFIGAFTCTNARPPVGKFLDCFLAERREPAGLDALSARFANPHYFTQIGRLLAGSDGLMQGNCIVFFPENVATSSKIERQDFAFFFLNKSQQIYYETTLPLIENILGPQDFATAALNAEESYNALGVWSYLHEYYHQNGPRPLHANLQAKMNFYAGLLEEVKVDCQSVLKCREEGLPYAQEVLEIVLFERLFRYPRQPAPQNNFDAGTGFFLFEWLYRNGYGIEQRDGQIHLDTERCLEGLRVLVDTILALESVPSDAQYKKVAKAFVRMVLPQADNGARFSLPADYLTLVGLDRPMTVAQFEQMPF